MSESSSAVVAGHICLDIIPRLKGESADLLEKLLVPGRLTVMGPAVVAVGACNVEAADALSGVRSWEETMSRVAAGWEHRWFNLPAADWRRDPRHQLWVKESTS